MKASTTPALSPTPSLLLEPLGGIAGDMLCAALLDLGVPLEAMRQALAALGMHDITLHSKKVMRGSFAAQRFMVQLPSSPPASQPHAPDPAPDHSPDPADPPTPSQPASHQHAHAHAYPHRHWKQIRDMLTQAPLSEGVKRRALAVFTHLAEAEASVHGVTPDEVSFHEVGAWDSIADIVGVATGLDILGVERVLFTLPVPVGSGQVQTAHGICPVPAPATLALLQGIEIESAPPAFERTTPTGAAVLAALGTPMPPTLRYVPLKTGIGAGSKNPPSLANVLRASLIQESVTTHGQAQDHGQPSQQPTHETIACTQVNLDDCNPEWLGGLMDTLLQAGALDVGFMPLQMKKNRPATRLEVLHHPSQTQAIQGVLFRETTTLGVRTHTLNRVVLPRQAHSQPTPYGKIAGKLAWFQNQARFSPEYEACHQAAQTEGIPLRDVYHAAMAAFLANPPTTPKP